jgi:hypothetical protein
VAVWGSTIGAVALALLGVLEALAGGTGGPFGPAEYLLVVLSTTTVGAILVTRLPHHLVGRLLLAGGLSLAISTGAGALADFGLNVHPGSVPGAIWFAVIANAAGGPFIGLLGGFVPLFFPTGRLPSPRWRAMLPIAVIPTVGPALVAAFGPFTQGTFPAGDQNPLALGGLGGQLIAVLDAATEPLGSLALLLVIASLVVRFRRAAGIEREQLKWFAVVGIASVLAFVVAISTGTVPSGPLAIVATVAWSCALLGTALLPVAIGIAVLRYRLYEIDRLISRTIAYGVLTAIIGGLFVGFILVFQAVLAPLTRSNELAVVGSTLLVFTFFQPIRRRVQRIVDRRFNRAHYDAERTVAAFAGGLRDEVELERVRAKILTNVIEVVEPSTASIWLRE